MCVRTRAQEGVTHIPHTHTLVLLTLYLVSFTLTLIRIINFFQNFYKKFLYEPFPLESNLKEVLHNHINAEISGGTIANKLDAVEYLTWTFFFRRLLVNPSYYGCDGATTQDIQVI